MFEKKDHAGPGERESDDKNRPKERGKGPLRSSKAKGGRPKGNTTSKGEKKGSHLSILEKKGNGKGEVREKKKEIPNEKRGGGRTHPSFLLKENEKKGGTASPGKGGRLLQAGAKRMVHLSFKKKI